jgi:hypothetical protein
MTQDRREPYCLTCGRPNDGENGVDCAKCEDWWLANPPPSKSDEPSAIKFDRLSKMA